MIAPIKGDRVRINNPNLHPWHDELGTVKRYNISTDTYSVTMDCNWSLYEFRAEDLELIQGTNAATGPESTNYYQGPRCECGSASVGSNHHSHYCPMRIGF